MADPRPLQDIVQGERARALAGGREALLREPAPRERGVIFLLGLAGHRANGFDEQRARTLYERSVRYAQRINQDTRAVRRLDYDPFEVQEFNSLPELIRRRPTGGDRWRYVILVTHAGEQQPAEIRDEIFLGDDGYEALDLQVFAGDNRAAVAQFQAQFVRDSYLRVIACGAASQSAELGIYLRELFGTQDAISLARVNVGFGADGRLGTPVREGSDDLRAVRDDEWLEVPAIPDRFRAP
jgi:hypothetical protein